MFLKKRADTQLVSAKEEKMLSQQVKDANYSLSKARIEYQQEYKAFQKQGDVLKKELQEIGRLKLTIFESFQTYAALMEQISARPTIAQFSKEEGILQTYQISNSAKLAQGATNVLLWTQSAHVEISANVTNLSERCIKSFETLAQVDFSSTEKAIESLQKLKGKDLLLASSSLALGNMAAPYFLSLASTALIYHRFSQDFVSQAKINAEEIYVARQELQKLAPKVAELQQVAQEYKLALQEMFSLYQKYLKQMHDLIVVQNKTDWKGYSKAERQQVKNISMLVQCLHNLCEMNLVEKGSDAQTAGAINKKGVQQILAKSKRAIRQYS